VDILDYEPMRFLHKCRYGGGVIQWLDLRKKPIRKKGDNNNDD